MYDQFKPAQKHHHEIYMNQSTIMDGIYYNGFNFKPNSYGSKNEMNSNECIYSTPNSISCGSQTSSRLSSPTQGHAVPVADNHAPYGHYYDDLHQPMDNELNEEDNMFDLYEQDAVFEGMKSRVPESLAFDQPPRVNRGGRKQVKIGTTKRNARERNRVRFINDCFEVLREHIPLELVGDLKNHKLSKVETLKYASIYIKLLGDLLESGKEPECQTFPAESVSPKCVKVKCEREESSAEQALSSRKRVKTEACAFQEHNSSISITNINININEPRVNTIPVPQPSVYSNEQYSPCSTSSSSSSISSASSNSYHHNQYYQHQYMHHSHHQPSNYQGYASYSKQPHEMAYSHQAPPSSYYATNCSKSFIINSFLNNAQPNCPYSLI